MLPRALIILFVGTLISAFPASSWANEVLDLGTVVNFRDVGGKVTADGTCVRRGMVFRSAHFVATSDADGVALLQRIRLRHYYDLRSLGEIRLFGSPKALSAGGVEWHQININNANDIIFGNKLPDSEAWAAFYDRIVDVNSAAFVRVLEDLASADVPAVYGCSFGKDRTGIMTALFLGTLGVDKDTIIADYAATTLALAAHAQAFYTQQNFNSITFDDYVKFQLTANPDTLRRFLSNLEQRYGSIADAVVALGLKPATRDALRARFLQPKGDDGC